MENSKRTIDFRFQPRKSQACFGLVDDHAKSLLTGEGALLYGFDPDVFDIEAPTKRSQAGRTAVDLTDDQYFFKTVLKPVFSHYDELTGREIDYGDPRAAIFTVKEHYKQTEFEYTVFARQNGKTRFDVVLWKLSVSKDFGKAPTRVLLSLSGRGTEKDAPQIMQNAENCHYWSGEEIELRGITQYEKIESSQSRQGVFAIFYHGSLPQSDITVKNGERWLSEAKEYWKSHKGFVSRFEIPDPQIQDMVDACARNILQAREEQDGVLQYQVGPTVYRGLWIIDGHFFLDVAHMLGRGEEAAKNGLLAVLRRVKPDGSVRIIPMHDKETGISIATMVRQCELLGDDEKLRELWPTILRGTEFIRSLFEKGQSMPGYNGIFPPAFLDGGISGPFAEHTTPLWSMVGLKMASEAGARLTLKGADEVKALFDSIMKSFEASAKKNMKKTESGIPYLPMNIEERKGYDNPQSATWAYCQAMAPGEIFEPESSYVQNLLALLSSLDHEEGIPEGTGWIHSQALWPYASMFNAQVFLYAGERSKAADYLYAFANHASPARVWREEQSLTSSHANEFCGDMPHNWGSVEFIRCARHLVLVERKGGVEIFRGLPEEWLPTAQRPLVMEKTTTRYGWFTVELTLKSPGEYNLHLEREGGRPIAPKSITLWEGEQSHLLDLQGGKSLNMTMHFSKE